jgi:hypothetical protein
MSAKAGPGATTGRLDRVLGYRRVRGQQIGVQNHPFAYATTLRRSLDAVQST